MKNYLKQGKKKAISPNFHSARSFPSVSIVLLEFKVFIDYELKHCWNMPMKLKCATSI